MGTSTTGGINPRSVPKLTPIASSDYFNALVQGFEQVRLSSSSRAPAYEPRTRSIRARVVKTLVPPSSCARCVYS